MELTVVYDMSYYVKLSALSIKTIPRSLTLLVLQISTFLWGTWYLIYRSNLTEAIIKIYGYLELTVVYDMSYYVKLSALSIKTIPRSLTLLVLQISTFLWGTWYLIYRSNLTEAIIKIYGYLELTVVYDMSYYVKLSALSIKTIPRSLTFFVLQISAFLCGMQYLIYRSNLT